MIKQNSKHAFSILETDSGPKNLSVPVSLHVAVSDKNKKVVVRNFKNLGSMEAWLATKTFLWSLSTAWGRRH